MKHLKCEIVYGFKIEIFKRDSVPAFYSEGLLFYYLCNINGLKCPCKEYIMTNTL